MKIIAYGFPGYYECYNYSVNGGIVYQANQKYIFEVIR